MAVIGSALIVDRDSELVSILSSYLATRGYRVVFTTRVREALRKLDNQRFSFIIIDPDLEPDKPMEIFRDLTRVGAMNLNTPLIFTTFNLEFMVPMPLVKRVDAILAKPFSLQQFSALLDIKRRT